MVEQENRGEPELESIVSRNGLPVLKCDDVFFNSKYDPIKDARKFVDRLKLDGKKVVIVLGGGFYYIPQIIKEQFPLLRVIVIEAEPRIIRMGEKFRKSDLKGLEIIVSSNVVTPADFSLLLGTSVTPPQVEFVEHQPSLNRFGEEYNQVKKLYKEHINRFLANLETAEFFGKRWLHNIISNLKLLQKRGCYYPVTLDKQLSVVLVVPGSTLDDVIPLLQKKRDKFILLALAPALRLLEKSNLRPDFVFSMDGGLGNGYHTIGLDTSGIPLFFPLYLSSNVLRHWEGPLIPFSFGSSVERFLLDIQIPEIMEKATVADFALQIAGLMGCKQLFLAGQDFAVQGAKHHCREYRFEQDALFTINRCRTTLKNGDVQWKDGWVKRGNFSSNKKFLMYKRALLETVNKLEIPVLSLTYSPFLDEVVLGHLDDFSGVIVKNQKLSFYSINIRAKVKSLVVGIKASLKEIGNQDVTPLMVSKIVEKQGMRAILELLKVTDLYIYDLGDANKRGKVFFNNIFFELKNISDKFQNLLNT